MGVENLHPTIGTPKQLAADPPAALSLYPKPALEALAVGARELARMLGISEATLWRWDSSEEFGPAAIKKLGRRLWPVAEVREWVVVRMPRRETWNALQAQRNGRPE